MAESFKGIQVVIINYMDTDTRTLNSMMITDGNAYTAMGSPAIPSLSQTFLLKESIFKDGTIFGAPDYGVGDIEVDNTDGYFDSFRFFGFDGQQIKVYQINDPTELLDDSANLMFTGTMDYPQFDVKKVTFRVKNRLQELSVPMQKKVFSGGLPDDLFAVIGPSIEYLSDPSDPEAVTDDFEIIYTPTYDGTYINRLEGEDNLAGRTKPMVFGRCLNIPMVSVNSSLAIYACNYDVLGNRKAVRSFNRVMDKGTDILFNADFATSSLLIAAVAPSGGYYNSCLAEGLVRFGSIPLGDVTADVDETVLSLCSAPQIVGRILTTVMSYEQGQDFSQGELDALNVLNPCPCGVYITAQEKVADVVIALLTSIGGWMCPDTLGVFRFGRISLPSPYESVATFDNDVILEDSVDRVPTGDDNRGIPAQQITLKHSRAWAVLSKGQTLESVDEYIRTFMANQYRSTISSDPDILEIHPSAPSLTFETLLLKGQRALIRNWDFQIGIGVIASPKADWTNISGGLITPTINTNNQLVLTPNASNVAGVRQILRKPGQFTPGTWKFGLTCATINLTATIYTDTGTIAAIVMAAPGDYSIPFIIDEAATTVTIELVNTVASALPKDIAICDNIYLVEILPGLTPPQEASRRLGILKSDFERFHFDTSVKESRKARTGDVIILKLDDRFDMAAGKAFRVVGKIFDTDKNEVSFDVVG